MADAPLQAAPRVYKRLDDPLGPGETLQNLHLEQSNGGLTNVLVYDQETGALQAQVNGTTTATATTAIATATTATATANANANATTAATAADATTAANANATIAANANANANATS